MKQFFLFLLSIALLAGCTKDEKGIVMKYGQTQCADQWGYGNTDIETKAKLGKFLDSIGIFYTKLNFSKSDPGIVCLACNCTSGGLFALETTEPFVAKLIEFGFHKQ